jgi:ABC-2 type transport system ATP-binding protein
LTPATSEITLSARNLTRCFGKQQVLHDVTLELKRGEVLGLLGHNGAGKSTTMQILTGCLAPHGGTVEICGVDLGRHPVRAKANVGYLPEIPPLYRELSVNQFLSFAACLHGIRRPMVADAVTTARRRCGLESVGEKIISTLSKGFQQRVGIAQAIVHGPSVIVLDEPTIGLDPAQIRDIRALIRELGDAGSVILSTHLLSEVENICDRVEIMQRGRLIYSDSSERMQQRVTLSGFIVELRNPPASSELAGIPGITRIEQMEAGKFRILHAPDVDPRSALLSLCEQRGWQLVQLTPLRATLEDVYVAITGDTVMADDALPGGHP